ncbi:MAG: InlB B-repeat-containing protein, partial [Bacilli bacterium]|nr:InlB B-repeat-containing protein [Bacilli bacterium]
MKFLEKVKRFFVKLGIVLKKFFIKLGQIIKKIYLKLREKYLSLTTRKKEIVFACVSSVLLVLIVLVIVSLASNKSSILTTNTLAFGDAFVETVEEVSTPGGEIVINDTNSEINGFKLTIEEASYSMPLDFVVRTYPIVSHDYGDYFNPITPLIEIDNGHEFSNEVMKVEIPIDISSDDFAMGFYYDEETSELEAIPTLELSSDKIVLGVKHFSKIFVSDIPLSTVKKLTSSSKSNVDTGFVPGLDDWHYLNYGSAIAMGGHCAGQSLTMSWYFSEKYKKENEARLYGRFDNNEEIDTPSFWEDDNNAYRFSSVVQNEIDWSSSAWIDFINYCVANPLNTFNAFAYSIKTTSTPQLMAIFPDSGTGHAIVAYKVVGNRIYVADPNYPGQTDRYVEFDSKTNQFLAYSSGANASDISSSGVTAYTKIVYVAKSALIDYGFISSNYNKLLNDTVGDTEFPSSSFEVLTEYNSDPLLQVWTSADNKVVLGSDYDNSLPQALKGKAIIRVTPEFSNQVYSLYLNNDTTPTIPDIDVVGSSLIFSVDLNTNLNIYNFLVELENSPGVYYYIDFVRVKVDFNLTNQTSTINFNSNGGSSIVSISQNIGSVVVSPVAPIKQGFVFAGWYSDISLKNKYTFSTMPNNDITLYAKWVSDQLQSNILGKYYLYSIMGV